jgi:hypothetical protein
LSGQFLPRLLKREKRARDVEEQRIFFYIQARFLLELRALNPEEKDL